MAWIWFFQKKKKKKCRSGPFSFCWPVWENVLGLHNQIFHFGLINKKMWIWMDFYRRLKSTWIGHSLSSLFWEMVLSFFPNRQLEIMIDAYLIALLNDLELDFHILVDES